MDSLKRKLVKEIMISQDWETNNLPDPIILRQQKSNSYNTVSNTIKIKHEANLLHELCHSLQPKDIIPFEKNYIRYQDDIEGYLNQTCERQAYAITACFIHRGINIEIDWNRLDKKPGRSIKKKINNLIKEIF